MKKEFLHTTPQDIQNILKQDTHIKNIWSSLTPLARNEFICWITSAKKTETRIKRIERMQEDLLKGKRRPCCWAGCSHR
jgi:uncharacterized protein YdeI (YjbR/CyaY-like superfamily)